MVVGLRGDFVCGITLVSERVEAVPFVVDETFYLLHFGELRRSEQLSSFSHWRNFEEVSSSLVSHICELRGSEQLSLVPTLSHIPRRIGIHLNLADSFNTFQDISAFL